jgi:hypothetical protein
VKEADPEPLAVVEVVLEPEAFDDPPLHAARINPAPAQREIKVPALVMRCKGAGPDEGNIGAKHTVQP